MGASLALSTPTAIPESIWPSAILSATKIAAPDGATRLLHVVGGGRMSQTGQQDAFPGEAEVTGVLGRRTGSDLTDGFTGQGEPCHEAVEAAINMSWLGACANGPLAQANGMRLPRG
jgi:hypothetical protein